MLLVLAYVLIFHLCIIWDQDVRVLSFKDLCFEICFSSSSSSSSSLAVHSNLVRNYISFIDIIVFLFSSQ